MRPRNNRAAVHARLAALESRVSRRTLPLVGIENPDTGVVKSLDDRVFPNRAAFFEASHVGGKHGLLIECDREPSPYKRPVEGGA